MVDRRSLTQGLEATPKVDATIVEDFVYGGKNSNGARPAASTQPSPATSPLNRVALSTRIRADYFKALKRASLERQMSGTKPDTLQDFLEEAIEPWLKANGYLP